MKRKQSKTESSEKHEWLKGDQVDSENAPWRDI